MDYEGLGYFGSLWYDPLNKDRTRRMKIRYMLDRTQTMVEYDGLPETIPPRNLELQTQTNGYTILFRNRDRALVTSFGTLGGERDGYYMPTRAIIANPVWGSYDLEIDRECVVIPNDSCYLGLIPLLDETAYQLTENELSLRMAMINSRVMNLITCPDDNTKLAVDRFLTQIEQGKLAAIADQDFLSSINAVPYTNSGHTGAITDLIELEQYIRATGWNALGLNANYNMKREAINSGESQLNNDILRTLPDDMLSCRRKAWEKASKIFPEAAAVSIRLGGAWADNLIEIEDAHNGGGNGEA